MESIKVKIELKKLPKFEAQITVEVSPEEYGNYKELTAKRLSERVEVPGFRRGTAPTYAVISHVGNETFSRELLQSVIPHTYMQAVEREKLLVISQPVIRVLKEDPFTYEAKVALLPEVRLKGYEKIRISKNPVSVSEQEVHEVIHEMRRQKAKFEPLSRGIQKGDRAEIDFQGFDEKQQPVEQTKSQNHPLFVGEGTLVPGFEEQLVGMKIGEKKTFPVSFPKDYQHAPFRGKTLQFDVEVKSASEPILPELSESFAEEILGTKKTVQEFQTMVHEDLRKRKAEEEQIRRENAFLEELLRKADLEIPPLLVAEEKQFIEKELQGNLEKRGVILDQYRENLKKRGQDLEKEQTAEAERRIKIRLILHHLFEKEGITMSEEEIGAEVQRRISWYPEDQRNEVLSHYAPGTDARLQLKNQLRLMKLFQKFLGDT